MSINNLLRILRLTKPMTNHQGEQELSLSDHSPYAVAMWILHPEDGTHPLAGKFSEPATVSDPGMLTALALNAAAKFNSSSNAMYETPHPEADTLNGAGVAILRQTADYIGTLDLDQDESRMYLQTLAAAAGILQGNSSDVYAAFKIFLTWERFCRSELRDAPGTSSRHLTKMALLSLHPESPRFRALPPAARVHAFTRLDQKLLPEFLVTAQLAEKTSDGYLLVDINAFRPIADSSAGFMIRNRLVPINVGTHWPAATLYHASDEVLQKTLERIPEENLKQVVLSCLFPTGPTALINRHHEQAVLPYLSQVYLGHQDADVAAMAVKTARESGSTQESRIEMVEDFFFAWA